MSGVVVTGASSGIGKAIALRLARQFTKRPNAVTASPVHLLVHYRSNRDGAEQTAEAIHRMGLKCTTLAADLSDPDGVTRFADQAFETLGGIETWVNNAGGDVLTGAAKDWSFDRKLRFLLDVDLCGTAQLSRIVGDRMIAQQTADSHTDCPPSMVFIGWDQAPEGMEGEAGMMFGPVKAAVMAFANSLAQTLAPNVRVNTVAPGWIRTAWGESTRGYWDDRAKKQSLMNRWGRPEDVAEAVAFLASPQAEFVTGQTINVNGGFSRRFDRDPDQA